MPNRRKLDVEKAVRQKVEKGMSYQEIADTQGVCKQAVHAAIRDLVPSPAELKEIRRYRDVEADIFAGLRWKILAKLDDATLQNMLEKHSSAAVLLMNSLFNNERLLRGQSTSNVANVHKAIKQLRQLEQDEADAPAQVIDAQLES